MITKIQVISLLDHHRLQTLLLTDICKGMKTQVVEVIKATITGQTVSQDVQDQLLGLDDMNYSCELFLKGLLSARNFMEPDAKDYFRDYYLNLVKADAKLTKLVIDLFNNRPIQEIQADNKDLFTSADKKTNQAPLFDIPPAKDLLN
jgi:hypothetical protein